ncbi:MFS general substrate transporter [Artomyces pyxidatus]|uniref:MFS general substrate transporter n=1 Tax=Artomyces pyxidatus TaxID=48021 RepID=A0ACB8SWW3_9AGAM|nr:MFS general substrate transporter [Artomyces pyxidatus]
MATIYTTGDNLSEHTLTGVVHEIQYEEGDRRNPINFSKPRKWAITMVACMFTALSAAAAGSYNLGFGSMTRDLNCTDFQATIGLSVYALGFGIIPLFSAPFSEELGRRPLYLFSCIGFLLMHLMVAEAKNIQTVILGRLLGGAFGSTGSTMVGGSIADIWRPHERGLPMSLFAVVALSGTGIGPVAAGWIEADPRFEWRWIQWFHLIAAGLTFCLLFVFMTETRTTVIQTRMAKKLRKETGDQRYRALAEIELPSLKTLLIISCTRPLRLLLTEPVVASISLWIGFAWGILYCMIESIGPAFQSLHGFGVGETGTVFVTVVIGSILGFISNMHQERLYQKGHQKRGPEARLYWACCGGVLFPIGMFIYAWTTFPSVPWIAMAIAITIFIWATFIIYLSSFSYLADCYGPYASSAIAGQSLCRNLVAMAFPLFTRQMFNALTYKWGNTLFACIAVLMAPIPFILFRYGPEIRARSTFSRRAMELM